MANEKSCPTEANPNNVKKLYPLGKCGQEGTYSGGCNIKYGKSLCILLIEFIILYKYYYTSNEAIITI